MANPFLVLAVPPLRDLRALDLREEFGSATSCDTSRRSWLSLRLLRLEDDGGRVVMIYSNVLYDILCR